MKTNISALMNMISEDEKKLSNLLYDIKGYVFNTETQELDGKINIIEDNKSTFDLKLEEITETVKRLSNMKKAMYEKNNSLKLSDGRTIQEAIVDNTNLRKIKTCYENLLNYKNTKKRVSEVNNSYFEVSNVNFDRDTIKKKLDEVNLIIQNTDFEISKLNSEEFIIGQ